ncbi:MAG: TIGR04076 family protein [Deltaproteobacteria bacterium]|nr:TIGR04076 family protein [Deltaproteobacteria bacterium]
MSSDREAALEKRWKGVQEHLGFTDEELATYRSFPKNVKAMEEGRAFVTHEMVVEVIEAKNCAAGYRVGDRFLVDSHGCLVAEECPPRLCAAAVWALKPLIDRLWEAFFHGATEVLHDTVRCPDVGVARGGAGEVTLRIRAVPRRRQDAPAQARP